MVDSEQVANGIEREISCKSRCNTNLTNTAGLSNKEHQDPGRRCEGEVPHISRTFYNLLRIQRC